MSQPCPYANKGEIALPAFESFLPSTSRNDINTTMSQRKMPSSRTAYTSHKDDLLHMAIEKLGYTSRQFVVLKEAVEKEIRGAPESSAYFGMAEEWIMYNFDCHIHEYLCKFFKSVSINTTLMIDRPFGGSVPMTSAVVLGISRSK